MSLQVNGIRAGYAGTEILHGVDLDVPSGDRAAVLGPSGCGKTTLLRVIAGFESATSGSVVIDGEVVVGGGRPVPPERRRIGYVAQEGNLFPHHTVAANIAYGLPRARRQDRSVVDPLLDLVGLDVGLAERYPHQLSGGQQQRVAIARALAPQPRLVLLDEPFSSLDAGLRAATRDAVAEALARAGVTVVLVTHDQGEALSFADYIAVMRAGQFTQVGTPVDLYERPVDEWTAAFIGDVNLLPGTASGRFVTTALGELVADPETHGPVEVLIRPEQLRLDAAGPVEATVVSGTYHGHDSLVSLTTADGLRLQARVAGSPPVTGEVVGVRVDGSVRLLPTAASSGHPAPAPARR